MYKIRNNNDKKVIIVDRTDIEFLLKYEGYYPNELLTEFQKSEGEVILSDVFIPFIIDKTYMLNYDLFNNFNLNELERAISILNSNNKTFGDEYAIYQINELINKKELKKSNK